jgi:Rod binding domain-containing protein
MTSVNPTSTTLGTEPITPPPGVKLETPEQEQMYRASLEFERVFVQQMLKPMETAGEMFSDDEGGSSSTSGYNDMAQDQLTQAVLDGGGLGLAATLYGQMAEAAGLNIPKAPGTEATADGGDA